MRRPLLSLTLAALLATPGATARADYKEDFREGVKAYDQADWPEVERRMRAALADRPFAELTSVSIFSSRRISYVPSTFLAIALLRQDRCEEALPVARRAETQAIAADRARDYLREMQELRDACLAAELPPALERARRRLDEAEALATEVGELEAERGDAATSEELAAAKTLLRRAELRLELASEERDLDALRAAGAEVAETLEALSALGDRLRQRTPPGTPDPAPRSRTPAAPSPVPELEPERAGEPARRESRAAASGGVDAGPEPGRGVALDRDAEAGDREIADRDAPSVPEPPAPTASEVLARAAGAFFSGDHDTVTRLAAAAGAEPPAALELLAIASAFVEARLLGAEPAATDAGTLEALRALRRRAPDLPVTEAFFPPELTRLWRRAGS